MMKSLNVKHVIIPFNVVFIVVMLGRLTIIYVRETLSAEIKIMPSFNCKVENLSNRDRDLC
jgi:hypothetical protein